MTGIIRVGLPLVAVVATMVMQAGSALAWNSYCETDPPINVVTPAGNHVNINNWITVATEDRALLRSVSVTASAASDGPGQTRITIHMRTPSGGSHPLQVQSSAQRYQTGTSGDGEWGQVIDLVVVLPIA